MPDMTNQQYAEYVMRKSPTSPLWGDLLRAFLIDALGVDEEAANREACMMEHAISEDSFQHLKVKRQE